MKSNWNFTKEYKYIKGIQLQEFKIDMTIKIIEYLAILHWQSENEYILNKLETQLSYQKLVLKNQKIDLENMKKKENK